MDTQLRSCCFKTLLVLLILLSGSLASYSNGKSRFQEFVGCNHTAPISDSDTSSKVENDEPVLETTTIPATPSASFPQNDYFRPVILGPSELKNSEYSTVYNTRPNTDVGNRIQTFSFGNNRFSVNSIGGNDFKEDKIPTLRPAVSRLSQFRQSVMAFRNTIQGNRFFDLEGSTKFVLFTRKNPSNGQNLQLHNKDSIDISDFQADKPTKLIIHGFSEIGVLGEWVMNLRDAYLSTSEANVIVADFSTFETFLLFWSNLPIFASKRVADLVTFLELTTGAKREDFHIIARSFGTHVAGVTGRVLQGRVGRITGLEPEPKVYGTVLPDYKLVSTDAQFVDIIHVNGRRYFFHGARFGLQPPAGHVDIYPNYSERNTGCPGTANNYGRFNFGFCQRGRGVTYFTESIKYPDAHPMCQCRSYSDYKSGSCTCTNENSKSFLGEYVNNKTRGVFQLAVPMFNSNWQRVLQTFRQASRL